MPSPCLEGEGQRSGVITVKVVGVHRTGAALMVVTPGRAGHRELQVTVSVTRGGVWRLSSA